MGRQKGYKQSEETKRKMSLSHKGNKSRTGQHQSLEERTKKSIAMMGKNNWTKGRIVSDQTRKKISEAHKGEKHHLWKGGQSRTPRYRQVNRLKRSEDVAGRKKPEQCEICGAIGKIVFDHDHITGKFRGWICGRCNTALGMVMDNSETLVALSNYLIKSRSSTNTKLIK